MAATTMIGMVREEKVRGRFTIKRVTHPMPCFEPYPVGEGKLLRSVRLEKTSGQIFEALCRIPKAQKLFFNI